MFNPEIHSIYKLIFQNKNKQTFLGVLNVLELNTTGTIAAKEVPFIGRSNSQLNLVNGIGTLEITINKLKYTDSGVFIVENIFGDKLARGNTTLIVNGMYLSRNLFSWCEYFNALVMGRQQLDFLSIFVVSVQFTKLQSAAWWRLYLP